jgi:hypothetical protein
MLSQGLTRGAHGATRKKEGRHASSITRHI